MEELLPFASKIGTNYAATSEEAEKITALLAGPISKLKQLQVDILRVKAHYDGLVEQQLALSREIEAHQALIAPIRRIPIDILQEIFLHCLPTKHNAVISSTECPILLTRICSGWRHIALNTPMLWSSIHVPVPICSIHDRHSPSPSSLPAPIRRSPELEVAMSIAKRQATAIREWLGRSGECVLAISIYDEDYRTPEEIYTVILDALVSFRQRWGALRCETPAWSIMRIAAIPASELPCLHTINFSGSSAYGARIGGVLEQEQEQEGVTRWVDSGILRAPRLHAITYNNITEDFTSFPLRREQLTSIILNGIGWNVTETISITHIAALLADCPLLRRCDLDIAPILHPHSQQDNSKSAAPQPKPIVLLHLTHFSIKAGRSNLAALFDALDAPALVQLEVLANYIVAASLHALLRRTADTMRSLTLDPQVFSRDDFFICLEICTDLMKLKLRRNYYRPQQTWPPPAGDLNDPSEAGEWHTRTPKVQLDDAFLRDVFMPASDAGAVLVPRLTTFECHTLNTFSDTGVLNALRARSAAVTREGSVALLSYALISFGRPQKEPMAHALKELAELGVKCVPFYTAPFPQRKHAATDGVGELSPVAVPWSVPIL
ncbi:hypothetical protein HYPSUDRAFT_39369 [Hypholoma sublateritium FD-334 SS-4]|uniref:F-box domain-containing protein n=1 Tax=Hypholoma sublateritium (strain FD-334 SS-4) TaxID=945553 RepID=A0A0D2NYN7_HYPSF|nr:hypothetical protein HYPSUDRAFT_39369 [Hypholoma sublateritium FD-334 SS-4]